MRIVAENTVNCPMLKALNYMSQKLGGGGRGAGYSVNYAVIPERL